MFAKKDYQRTKYAMLDFKMVKVTLKIHTLKCDETLKNCALKYQSEKRH